MLTEKKFNRDDICTMKIITGEEIVARVHEHNDHAICISKPLVLNLGMDQTNGQYQLQLMPTFLLSARKDARIWISLAHIIAITASEDAARTSYISNTSDIHSPQTPIPQSIR